MDSLSNTPSPVSASRPSSKPANFPVREDCWSEDATFTLIDAWGERHLSLNRGNLRQRHWQEVADAVNARHFVAANPKSRRTDVQCKNRVDTLKKKYKIEKGRVLESDGSYTSPWPFFSDLDSLVGANFPKPSPPLSASRRRRPSPFPWNFPVAPRSAKRPAPEPDGSPVDGDDDSMLNKTLDFSAFAAVAAAAAAAEKEDEECEIRRSRSSLGFKRCRQRKRHSGCVELAMAIEKFAETYERVEKRKQKEMVELEIQRMQFSKDMECQRFQLFMETKRHQLRKIKRTKPSSSPDDDYRQRGF